MNRMLAILAAGILAVSPVAGALADDHAAHSDVAVEAEVSTDTAVEAHEYTLQDGTKLHVEGDMAYVMDAEGNKVAAPAGEHTLDSGTVIEVSEEGKVSGLPAADVNVDVDVKHDTHAE